MRRFIFLSVLCCLVACGKSDEVRQACIADPLRAEILARAEADRAELQARVATVQQENAELEYDIAHAGDPETIASIARAKLGLVLPGEKIFYDVSN